MTQRVPWYRPTNGRLIILGVIAMFLFGVGGVVWGTLFPQQFQSTLFDAGPESSFAIGKVTAFPQPNIFVIGLEDGELRAIDGVAESTRCTVEYHPDDARGTARNPKGTPGVYVDPCSGAVWAANGDALAGSNAPLRTFEVMRSTAADGSNHVSVEVIGDRHPSPQMPSK